MAGDQNTPEGLAMSVRQLCPDLTHEEALQAVQEARRRGLPRTLEAMRALLIDRFAERATDPKARRLAAGRIAYATLRDYVAEHEAEGNCLITTHVANALAMLPHAWETTESVATLLRLGAPGPVATQLGALSPGRRPELLETPERIELQEAPCFICGKERGEALSPMPRMCKACIEADLKGVHDEARAKEERDSQRYRELREAAGARDDETLLDAIQRLQNELSARGPVCGAACPDGPYQGVTCTLGLHLAEIEHEAWAFVPGRRPDLLETWGERKP